MVKYDKYLIRKNIKGEKIMKDTKDIEEKNNHEKNINVQSLGNIFLLIIVVLIFGNALLIYYVINSKDYSENDKQPIINENVVDENNRTDTIANILNETVLNTAQPSTTVDSTDIDTKKIMNEDLVVLYDGLILDTSKMDQVELKYIDSTNPDKDKYVITYYNYENFDFVNSSLGKLSDQIYEGYQQIENVGKIAISEGYQAIPRSVKVVNTLPTAILENNSKLAEFDSIKVIITDLDGNGTEENIVILANKSTGYSKISLFDSFGGLIDDLAYIEKSKWNQNTSVEYYLSLENINVIDVDNDGVMEILVEIPKYEGESSISILKYKNNTLTGKTNIECSLLP